MFKFILIKLVLVSLVYRNSYLSIKIFTGLPENEDKLFF